MSWKKLSPVVIAMLLALPAAVVVTPASAQTQPEPTLPFAPGVKWQYQVNHAERLYLDFEASDNPNSVPDCYSATPPSVYRLSFDERSAGLQNSRQDCSYTVGVEGAGFSGATFETRNPVLRAFNVTGNTSLHFQFTGFIPSNTRLKVEVQSGNGQVLTGTREVPASDVNGEESLDVRIEVDPTTGRYTFEKDQVIRVRVSAEAIGANAASTVTPGTWRLSDTGSYLTIRAADSLRAATWIQDQDGRVRNLFEPIPEDREIIGPLPRVVGFFAVESAIADREARGGGAPIFQIDRDGVPQEVTPQGDVTIRGVLNDSLSLDGTGRAVWNFPLEYVDYRGWKPGEYNLTVDAQYLQGTAIRRGIQAQFLIGAQSVRLDAHPGEQLSHNVRAGGATTFVMVLNNTGSVNDTYQLVVEDGPATPAVGWGVSLGGPSLEGNLVRIAPQEQKILTATVRAPFANPGDSSIFVVTARSMTDPKAQNASVTLVSRISEEVKRDVGVIGPNGEVVFEPADETLVPIYAWNKGTRAGNLSISIDETLVDGWTVDLLQAGQRVDRLVVSSLGAGDIAPATLVVRGPSNRPAGTFHDVKVNVTLLDVAGHSAEQTIRFVVNPSSSVKVQVLDVVNGAGHAVELQPTWQNPSEEPAFMAEDGANGTWFRTWITNTGRIQDNFVLGLSRISLCDDFGAYPEFTDENFGFYYRDALGFRQGVSNVRLDPGQTAELYVWVEVNPEIDVDAVSIFEDCNRYTYPFKFAVTATGENTDAYAVAEATVTAADSSSRPKTVHLEAVKRLEDYRPEAPLVDISNAHKNIVDGGIEVGKNATFYVRLTNGASYKGYTDAEGRYVSSDAVVRVGGYDFDSGWNVSIRPRLAEQDMTIERNPYTKVQYLNNTFENRVETWRDMELEVVVEPPKNTTLPAGLMFPFYLQAAINGSSNTFTLPFHLTVTQFANVSVWEDAEHVLAHPGEPGAFLLLVANNGSSAAQVNLRAFMTENTPDDGQGWTIVLGANNFTLPPNTNRTVALLVTPPSTATQGLTGEINVTYEYANVNSLDVKKVDFLRLTTEVVPPDSLSVAATDTVVTAAPGNFANFTFAVQSNRDVHYRAVASPIPNWTAYLAPAEGNLSANEPQTMTLVLRVPSNVITGSTFSSVIRVFEVGNGNNFDTIPVSVNIQGGNAIASISLPSLRQTVDRGTSETFPVQVQNIGNAPGLIRLKTTTTEPWTAAITGVDDPTAPAVFLNPNELRTVNVTVTAPLVVPENTIQSVEVFAYSPDLMQSAHATIQAPIHDYGLSVAVSPPSIDLVPGTGAEVIVKLRNRGNDNDTLNLSYVQGDLPEWAVTVPVDRVQLEPGAERELRVVIQSPTTQLPSPRTYNFKFYAGTLGGAAVNLSKNDTSTAAVTVYRYAALDVDRDDYPEIAVDLDKRNGNGYEAFREVFGEGVQTEVVEATLLDGKTRFLLDVPSDRHDGIADIWFDPENVYGYEIPAEQAHDVTGDRAPDYLLDTDRNLKIERTYDTETDRYLATIEIKTYGDDRIQYLVQTRGDGRFTKFYDPETRIVTDTQRVAGQPDTIVGIDTDDDEKVDKYYDVQNGRVSDARVANFADFAQGYWYFFVAFALMLLVTIVLVVRRRRNA